MDESGPAQKKSRLIELIDYSSPPDPRPKTAADLGAYGYCYCTYYVLAGMLLPSLSTEHQEMLVLGLVLYSSRDDASEADAARSDEEGRFPERFPHDASSGCSGRWEMLEILTPSAT